MYKNKEPVFRYYQGENATFKQLHLGYYAIAAFSVKEMIHKVACL